MSRSHRYIEHSIWELHWLKVSAGFTSLSLSSLKQKALVVSDMESDWDVLVLDGNIKKKLGRRRFQSSSMLLPLMRVDFELDSMSAVLERAVTALNSLTLCSEVACSKAFQSFMIQSINVESTVRTEFEINQQQHATYTSIDPYFWSESPYGKNSPAYLGNICEDVLWGKHVTTFSISHCSEKALKATVCWGHAGPLTRCEQLDMDSMDMLGEV